MTIVDANVLLYAVNRDSAHHGAARRWLADKLDGPDTVGVAWIVILAFLRVSTNPRIFRAPLTVEQATGAVQVWLDSPNVVVVSPSSRHVSLLTSLINEAGTAGNLVNDAHLAAMAIEHDASIGSFDADFSRFTGVRWERPAA